MFKIKEDFIEIFWFVWILWGYSTIFFGLCFPYSLIASVPNSGKM